MTMELEPGKAVPLPDGFQVEWASVEEEGLLWFWDDIHSPTPATPAHESVQAVTMQGAARAGAEVRDPRRTHRKRINGYSYSAASPEGPPAEALDEYQRRMEDIVAGTRERWDTEFLPRLERDLAYMRATDLGSLTDAGFVKRIDEFLEMSQHHWYIHMMTVGPLMNATGRLAALYAEITGSEDEAAPYRLLWGFPNKTLEADRALRDLAARSRRSEDVREAFTRSPERVLEGLGRSGEGRAFRGRLDDFLDTYGYRSMGMDLSEPSWREDPTFPLLMVKAHLQTNSKDLEAEASALSREREEGVAEVLRRIGSDDDLRGRFETLLGHCQALWPLREDHSFYIDQGSAVMVRRALVEAGRRLASAGRISGERDVFFLQLDEIRAALSGDDTKLHALVEERRSDWEQRRSVTPPPFLGTLPEGDGPEFDSEMRKFTNPVVVTPDGDRPRTLRGVAGSAGTVSGVARVVRSPDEFANVRPGDILVCCSTTPAWTPIFGTVAALVTDAGGVLSHTAIVAREYGLPAVVGTKYATRFVRDGQAVTVDGERGLVHLR